MQQKGIDGINILTTTDIKYILNRCGKIEFLLTEMSWEREKPKQFECRKKIRKELDKIYAKLPKVKNHDENNES